jgi:hypothetical protein
MRKDIGDHKDGVAICISNSDIDLRAVFTHDSSVKSERKRKPLELLYSTINVAVEINAAALLKKRTRFKIETRRICVSTYNLKPCLGDRLLSDDCSENRTILATAKDLIARLKRFECGDIAKTRALKNTLALCIAPASCLGRAEIAEIFLAVRLKRNKRLLRCHR